MAPGFEIWQSPGGMVWKGQDQEEAFLAGLRRRRPGVIIVVIEVFSRLGMLRPRLLAHYDGRQTTDAVD